MSEIYFYLLTFIYLLTYFYLTYLANNAVNEITGIMTCSKSTVNASESCKRNDADDVC